MQSVDYKYQNPTISPHRCFAFEFLAVKWGLEINQALSTTYSSTHMLMKIWLMVYAKCKYFFVPSDSRIELSQTTLPTMTEHFHYLLIGITSNRLTQILLPVCSSLTSLIHHTHAHMKILLDFLCQLHTSCCPCLRPAHCPCKKMFSNTFHLPLFISILCRMSLTACKLIYNAFFSWVGWRMDNTMEAGGLGMGAGSGCDVVAAMKTYILKGKFDWGNFHPWLPWLQQEKVWSCYWLRDYYGNHRAERLASKGMRRVSV